MGSVTNSALNAFAACPRKFHNQYNLKRVPLREAPALSFGRSAHDALDLWWSVNSKAALGYVNSLDLPHDEKTKLYAMIFHYDPPEFDTTKVETEQKFEMRLPDGTLFEGKADLILTLKNGDRVLVEHKTTSEKIEGWGAYWQRLVMDSQLAIYAKAMNCRRIYYDVLAKPLIRTRKDESPEEFRSRCLSTVATERSSYYQFREIVRTKEEADNAWADVEQRAIILAHARKLELWPRISTSCRTIYGTCAYLDSCTGMAKIDDDSAFRTKEEEHEEL